MNNKVKLGLTLGIFFAFLHFFWAIMVAIGIAETYLNWILPLHFIGTMFSVVGFSIVNAIVLIIMAFVCGFICGWLGVWVYSWFDKKKK